MSLNAYLLTYAFNYPMNPISFEPSFFNLSHVKSLEQYSKLFHLGLKHVPIPKSFEPSIVQSSWKLTRDKLLWKEYFANIASTNAGPYNYKLKLPRASRPFPNHLTTQNGILPSLMGIQKVIDEFTNQEPLPTATPELATLKNIRNTHPHVVFTASDKNLGLCAIHINDYHSLAMDHLRDLTTYEVIHSDLRTISMFIQISNIMPRFKNLTNQEQGFLLHPREFSLPKFHLLPKVHKKTTKLQTRPIIGATNWCTTPVSVLFDERLKQHLPSFPAVLRNSQDLVKCLENITLQPSDWLVTMDVVALYPNIDLGLLNHVLASLDNSFAAISDFITRNNYFVYNNQIYRQRNGIAMGTNCAVNLAQIYLGTLLDSDLMNHSQIRLYKRYIDDIFAVFNGTESELLLLFETINQMVPGIKITFDYSKTTAEFLDLKIFKEANCSVGYSTHQKSQNKYHYLSPRSCHPTHTLSGFIKGELIRYSRNSSQEFYFEHTKQLFLSRLLNRGYSRTYLLRIFALVTYTGTSTVERPPVSITALVLPYSVQRNYNALIKTLNALFAQVNSKLQSLRNTKDLRLMLVYKKNKSISDVLCRSALTEHQSILLGRPVAPVVPPVVPPVPPLFFRDGRSRKNISLSFAASRPPSL